MPAAWSSHPLPGAQECGVWATCGPQGKCVHVIGREAGMGVGGAARSRNDAVGMSCKVTCETLTWYRGRSQTVNATFPVVPELHALRELSLIPRVSLYPEAKGTGATCQTHRTTEC
jgi:hypothetical protein